MANFTFGGVVLTDEAGGHDYTLEFLEEPTMVQRTMADGTLLRQYLVGREEKRRFRVSGFGWEECNLDSVDLKVAQALSADAYGVSGSVFAQLTLTRDGTAKQFYRWSLDCQEV
jgi:hypothetical protein